MSIVIRQLTEEQMATINPYISFDGYTEEAFNFYRSVFGGDFSAIMRYKDVPSEVPMPEHNPDRVVHISLPISKESSLMGSDRPDVYGPGVMGNSFSICVETTSEEETRKLFEGLSAGGTITMRLEKAFWGAYFGMCIDKYGVQWRLSYDVNQF